VGTLLITGASSLVGKYLQDVVNPQWSVVLVSRHRPVHLRSHFQWQPLDIERDELTALRADTVIHLAPLPLISRHIAGLQSIGVTRLVAIGTTSRFTKMHSDSPTDRKIVSDQARAETEIVEQCERQQIAWTVLRPTLVYDGRLDKNVAAIARFIRRFGFFPVVGAARGLRQPLHARDLAAACLAVLDKHKTWNKAYNLAGAERLTYRAMLERIFVAVGRPPRIIQVPRPAVRSVLRLAALYPRYRYLTPAMADRMNQDMVFEVSDAQRDFGFSPRPFQPEFGD